jgi:anti-sigma regulatory factor (Ser/Thr protein kinase)
MITPVRDPSGVGDARRVATAFARAEGLAEDKVARIGLVATEMATNLLKHAGEGMVAVERYDGADTGGIELLALDKGPGIADVARSLGDGFSTAGSPGTGLGAIERKADKFAVFSRPGQGTAVMARFAAAARNGAAKPKIGAPEFGAVLDPYPGESVCGDRWATDYGRRGLTMLLVDGSGHGPLAAAAAETAAQVFADNVDNECVALVKAIHAALAPTRGAALAVARIDRDASVVRFVGVGNITGILASGGAVRRMVSHNGTVGHIAPRIREFVYPFTGAPLVILHSDGISARWDLAAYPGLAASHPALVAGVCFRDSRRGRDDAAVVAVRAEG